MNKTERSEANDLRLLFIDCRDDDRDGDYDVFYSSQKNDNVNDRRTLGRRLGCSESIETG